jgi:hypothetical protein
MRSLWITLILVAIGGTSFNSPSLAQTPEQLYQKDEERIEKKGEAEATQLQKTNVPKLKQPRLDRIGAALSRGPSRDNAFLGKEEANTDHLINGETLTLTGGTQAIWDSVLQFFKMGGYSLIIGGILTILIIYLLIMSIILLRAFLSDKRMA